ncbi:hypothetical protein VM1G_06026 [Cytospora mali]|uniref:Inner kinetochore subunit AME1 domain-containing protein n=1 Tax=Cytospora mali TaxID=578113 RepID=A0A194W390_CYTMA|nr:hypothetical protein VM1G_06026 [Valsa mali]
MDLTREERMRSRMRGAARHQVQNADFGSLFTIPGIAPQPEPEPEAEPESSEPAGPSSEPSAPSAPSHAPSPAPSLVQRTNPNTSAKRRRLDSEGTAAPIPRSHSPTQPPPAQSGSASRRSQRLSRSPINQDPYDLENAPGPTDEDEAVRKPTPPSRPTAIRAPGSRPAAPISAVQNAPLQSSPLPTVQLSEEVGESPADQPGSGQRRRFRAKNAITSSALLQSALRADDNDTADRLMQSSSPLSRKSRKSVAETAASRTSTRTSLRRSARLSGSSDDEVNELSSDMLAPVEEASPTGIPEEHEPTEAEVAEIEESIIDQAGPDETAEMEAAEEVDDREAARRLGRKRQRRSIPAVSPELISDDVAEEPSAKRPRKPQPPKTKKRSPAKQKQPKAPRAKPSKPSKPAAARRTKTGGAGGPPVPVKIQRFSKPRRLDEDDADADDVLNTEIPFANRGGVNAVDVLAQMCEEIIDASLQSLKDAFSNAQDAATKKELRTKMRALEAFQEELRTRLLEHTIALDTLFALKRRVREAQKEKLKLRERIIQIRAEREQVALRMDAVRVKHDEDSKEALHNINVSSAMHDIELAIEQGRAAAELSVKDQKTADLSNLELLISRVTEQACSVGPSGGTLKQIRSFNAFLERAAAVL